MREEAQLGNQRVDQVTTGLKGIVGAIPIVGSLVAEIVGAVIPNQRVDRIADFATKLASQVEEINRVLIQKRLLEPEGVDIVEEALWQSARALSDERRTRIAAMVKSALTKEEVNLVESKKLLLILNQLNDFELLLLRSYAEPAGSKSKFMETHGEALQPVHAYIGAPKETLDKHAIRKSMEDHLKALGLITPRFWPMRRGELPEFDRETGTIRPSGYYVSLLGRLLLREADFYPKEDDFYDKRAEDSLTITSIPNPRRERSSGSNDSHI